MKKSASSASQAQELEVIEDAHGLKPEELKQAVELQTKNPEVVKMTEELRQAMQKTGEKYIGLCESLRNSQLNGPDMVLLMRSLGFRKQRITEIRRVISVPDELWEKYKARQLSFKATLTAARGGLQLPAGETPDKEERESEDGEGEGGGGGSGGAKIHRMPKGLQTELVKALNEHPLKDTPGSEGYEFVYKTKDAKLNVVEFRIWIEKTTTEK